MYVLLQRLKEQEDGAYKKARTAKAVDESGRQQCLGSQQLVAGGAPKVDETSKRLAEALVSLGLDWEWLRGLPDVFEESANYQGLHCRSCGVYVAFAGYELPVDQVSGCALVGCEHSCQVADMWMRMCTGRTKGTVSGVWP